ncbi:uncharacterized protein LOC109833285 [Asparagus officinalis]|uniref:uncharacterized protein LOC109833285 n=1 Tax=Asparagus officinalis TaxID=4686 RepID=UPI00098E007A|nr:uncharacterized protein LOC109833285 [Asparagus officinalis]
MQVLYNDMGHRITDGDEIAKEFVSYYKNLMGKAKVTSKPNFNIIQSGPCLSNAQASLLSNPVTKEEIRKAIFSMYENKSPGPDGYGFSFFKSAWSIVGNDVTLAIEEFFKSGKLLGVVNSTSITLIPKVKCPKTPANFRPISCYMLKGLKFPEFMINRIMACVTSPKYSISLHGSLHGYFKGERGLRQGDPLSPYLFILGMEYLSRSLNILKNDSQFRYHPKCGKMKLTHLIFADDLLLFGRGDLYSIQKLYQCVRKFGETTGLEANQDKCSVFFGGVNETVKNDIINLLGFKEGSFPIRYLGVPLICKKLSYVDCNALINQVSNQFQTWIKHRKLSYAGRLEVIRSVILGIQVFWTSNYVLPIKVTRKIDEMCRSFLWGNSKSPLVAWESVCLGRKQGGLGVFSATTWNLAASLKLLWVIHINKESLWIKWIHGNYLKQRDIWNVSPKIGDSWMWKQILKKRDKAMSICGGCDNLLELLNSCLSNSKPRLSTLYHFFSPVSQRVPWHDTIWDKMSYPKHTFIFWLAVQNRLLTQDRLMRRGVIDTNVCRLCSAESLESRNHLFFECGFSSEVWNCVMNWLKFTWKSCDWRILLEWFCTGLRGKGFKHGIKRMALAATIYRIWVERNARIFQQKKKSMECLIKDIKMDILMSNLNAPISDENKEWLCSL